MKTIVISGVSIVNAGALSILNSVARELCKSSYSNYRIIFIVHENLITITLPDNVEILEIQIQKVKWLKRLYIEYAYFYSLSKKIKPYLWFSLHEITPFVKAQKRVVYCHHPHLFVKQSFKILRLEPTIFLFKIVFHIINKLTLYLNDYVVVQQTWMRQGFVEKYDFPKEKIILSIPQSIHNQTPPQFSLKSKQEVTTFIYPVFPRSFKNFEIICEAVKGLVDEGIANFKVLFTFSGKENKYAAQLVSKYQNLSPIEFIGFQSYKQIQTLYQQVDAMIFTSLIESWGLPLSEFKKYEKPIVCINLPYAKETLGDYDKILFFEPNDVNRLKHHIQSILINITELDNIDFQKNKQIVIEEPFTEDWEGLFNILLKS
jgi:glycosyltransferase involved in cell wall biosynthesis